MRHRFLEFTMRDTRRLALTAIAIVFGLTATAAARAGDLTIRASGVAVDGPSCGALSHLSSTGSIWLGHVTGGSIAPGGLEAGGVIWRDAYACFDSRKACQSWQRGQKAAYRGLDGYRTCLIIR
jgi:hypothetical protein